jgi:sugar phosphate isomerase/epimerase
MAPKPISLQLYTVRTLLQSDKPMDVIQRIADIGYRAVEGFVGDSPTEFRRQAADMGLEVSSYFGGVPTPDDVNKFIDTAKELGVKNTVAGFWIPELETVEAIEASAAKVASVLPKIHEAGLTFSLHNHWMEFGEVEGKMVVDRLIEGCPEVGLELDIYWASNFGAHKSEDMVARYRDRIHLMHVKDGPMTQGSPMVPVGEGKVDIPACIQAADPKTLDWLIVELDEFDGDMMVAVERSYRYLVGRALASGTKQV